MRARRTLLAGVAAVAVLVSAVPVAAGPALHVVRDREAARFSAKVAGFQDDTTIEPSIAVNPASPLHAVIGYQAGRTALATASGAAANGYAVTFDGGRHWTSGLLPKLTTLTGGPFTHASDPVVAFGPGNTVYFSSLAMNGETRAVVNHTSHDGGRHWEAPTTVFTFTSPVLVFNDKNWVVVDNGTGPGHHTGRVYVVWDTGEPAVLASYSDDKGKTWVGPNVVYTGQGIGAIPMVLPNGDLAVVFVSWTYLPAPPGVEPPNAEFDDRFLISTARGAGRTPTGAPLVFTPPLPIASYRANPVRDLRELGFPSADVDRKSGRIAVAWQDARFRDDDANDIVVSTSTDGVNWTSPARVNAGATDDETDHFTPAVAFGSDGALHVAYRQRPNADLGAASPYVDTFYQRSTDAGRTWTPALRVNRVRTDLRFAAWSRDAAFLGDYMQVAVAGPFAYVVRCEALRVSPRDRGALPPTADRHQRTWVAVVGPAGRSL